MSHPDVANLRFASEQTRRSWRLVAALTALFCLPAASASAQRVIHRVSFGETLEAIAKDYYGDAKRAEMLARVNGREMQQKLGAGDRLRIPTAWNYRVPRDTSLRDLAKRLLGQADRAVALRAFNRIHSKVRRGRSIVVPFTLTHVAKDDDTFAEIAERYYGDPGRARLIAEYNGLKGSAPAHGAELEIPIGDVQIRPEKLRELVNQRLLGVSPATQQRQRQALQEANGLLRRGQYWAVPLRLVRMLAGAQADDQHVAEVFKLLAVAYVAIGKRELAIRAFREALLRHPTLKLDPVTVSPKVISTFVDAKSGGGRP